MGRLTVSLLNGPNYRPNKIARARAESALWKLAAMTLKLGLQLLGRDRTALMFHHMATVAATPRQRGRPFGSSQTHTLTQLAILRASVLELEDGSARGRRRAIAEVLAQEQTTHRPALRKHFRAHLPKLGQKQENISI